MPSRLVKSFVVLLLIISLAQAQSASGNGEDPRAREEQDKKLLSLVEQIISDTASLRLPENRIRINIALAGALWPRDEKRARSLFKEAVTSLSEITAAIDNGDPVYLNQAQLPQQLRQEMVQIAANHDPRLAVDFLRATRTESTSRPPNSGLTNLEAQLQMRVAIQVAAKDPNLALSVAEDSLKITVDYQALNLLHSLQSQDKALAEKFLEDILKGIRTYGIGNSSATPIALNLLRAWTENNRAATNPDAQRTPGHLSLSNLDDQMARELSTMVINALLSNEPARTLSAYGRTFIDGPSTLYSGQVQSILQQLKPMLPDIEKLVPGRAAALRARIVEFDKSYEAQKGPWVKYQELSQTGTPEALLEAAKTAPSEFVDGLIRQAAWKTMSQGDDDGARQIAEKIADPRQRVDVKSQLVRQALYRVRAQEKLTEARALISRLPSAEEQATLLAQIAASFVGDANKPTALQLLAEARALIGDRAASYSQLSAQLQIANTYQQFDASMSAAIIEGVIGQLNELAAAAVVLNGFDLQQYFRNGEFVINSGNPLNMSAQQSSQALGLIAGKDFDRARLVAELFQRPEMRLMALLQIVQAALTAEAR